MAILGISGKIGAGKDTVAKIIQYLTSGSQDIMSYDEYQTSQSKYRYDSTWQVKRFADKLKDIVCLLIGCTREQLEDNEFKNKELGEEWWVYNYFNMRQSYKEVKYESISLIKYTPRILFQAIGTDLFRNQIHPDIWINATLVNYKTKTIYKESSNNPFDKDYKEWEEQVYPNWIISDLRFQNEFEAIKQRGGICIRVNRDFYTGVDNHLSTQHQSETDLDDADFDYYINNDGDIKDLVSKIKGILTAENII